MHEDNVLNRANDIIDRVFALDDAIANARAFRALLENLHARDLSTVQEPHITAIAMVRAGILRSLILSVMACLDPKDRRGNRASVGQILDMLMDATVVARFPAPGEPAELGAAALQQARSDYGELVSGVLFKAGRQLRNDAIAHLLRLDDPTPTVSYEAIYGLQDASERLTMNLYQVCYRGVPKFLGYRDRVTSHADVFWETYFKGMRS